MVVGRGGGEPYSEHWGTHAILDFGFWILDWKSSAQRGFQSVNCRILCFKWAISVSDLNLADLNLQDFRKLGFTPTHSPISLISRS
jgi:hypothetical protein